MNKWLFTALLVYSATGNAQESSGKLLWKYKTNARIIATPRIDDNKIYYGDTNGDFYCQSAINGALNWKFSAGKSIRSSAAIADDHVYFGSENGYVYSLNATSGKLQWKFKTMGEKSYDRWDYYRSSPLCFEGVVYIGSGDGFLYAIHAKTGKLLWKYDSGAIIHADPVISADMLYIGNFSGFLYALDRQSGHLVWKFKTVGDRYFPKGEVQKAVRVLGGELYFGSRDYNIYALNKKTGEGLWNWKEPGSWIIATPSEKDSVLYFGTSDSHSFYAVNAVYGDVKWKTPLNMRVYGDAAFFDTLVLAGCYNGFLYGFSANSGKISWKFQTDGSRLNYYTVYDSTDKFRPDLVLYGVDERVLDLGEEKILKLGAVISSPVVKDGIVYFGSTDGNMYAVTIVP